MVYFSDAVWINIFGANNLVFSCNEQLKKWRYHFVRSRVCARETLRSAPHRREQKFVGAHVWRGGVEIFLMLFWSTFSPNQAILNTFLFLAKSNNSKHFLFFSSFFSQKKYYCGHYVCLASSKIVVILFACHLHKSIFQLTPSSQWGGLFRSHQPIRDKTPYLSGRGWYPNNFFIGILRFMIQKFETLRQPLLWLWIAVVRTTPTTTRKKERKNT